ncbi:flippase [Tritonibacter scottomollicae]|uniref:flippase n=1 Tax=Tritonibacter scottomollicae TaxID=483013 RepID=UPI003AA8FF31
MIGKIHKALADRPVAKRIARNVFWLGLERASRLIIALVVAIFLARYLGPEKFGLLNLALAFVSIFATFAAFGMNGVVPKDLVKEPQQAGNILGSSLLIGLTCAVISYIALVTSAYLFNPENPLLPYLVAVIGTSLLFKTTQIVNFWFESQVDSKVIVWTENAVILVASGFKVFLAVYQAPLIVLAAVIASEAAVIALAALVVYSRRAGSIFAWSATWSRVRLLAAQSWPLLLSSAAWILYTRIDQIMIGRMIGSEAVGYYTAATRLSDATNILPGLLVVSIVPAITLMRESSREQYLAKFQIVYDAVFGISIAIAIVISLFSEAIIAIAFGDSYGASEFVLRIQAWSIVFISMAVVSGRYLINEGRQVLTMYRHMAGVVLNAVLNYLLIGAYGIQGAAAATLISLFVVNYLLDALHPDTRVCFVQKTKSFMFLGVLGAKARS